MRKEVIFALIIGVLIGGVFLYGIKLANSSALLPASEPVTKNDLPQPTPTQSVNQIKIVTPEDHAVVFESILPIKGSTVPGSTVVIVSDDDEKIIDTDNNGSFDTTISLTGGENNILISAFSQDTPLASVSMQIIYTTNVIE